MDCASLHPILQCSSSHRCIGAFIDFQKSWNFTFIQAGLKYIDAFQRFRLGAGIDLYERVRMDGAAVMTFAFATARAVIERIIARKGRWNYDILVVGTFTLLPYNEKENDGDNSEAEDGYHKGSFLLWPLSNVT